MITSRQNTRLKNIRRFRRCKGDEAVLEGPHLLGEALDAGLELPEILWTPDFRASPEGRLLEPRLPRPPREVDADALASATDADSPRGCLAVALLPRPAVSGLPRVPAGVYLFLDGLQDPGNLGALARTAEAAGATGLALAPGTAHPNHPRALRASAGSLVRLPTAREVTPEGLTEHLGSLSPTWAALATRGGRDLYQPDEWVTHTLILALGAEGPGLSAEVARRASLALTIPLEPPVESLNATVAAALVLFEVRRRRQET